MPFERWGSLSVDDHVNTSALVANILLYDRLILPVMTEQADRDERAYWVRNGWDPDLQLARIDQLEDLAIPRPWDATLRARFRTRLEQLAAERVDADPKHATRMILAEEQIGDKLPEGVDRVTVVAAYNSTKALTADFHVAGATEHLGAQACLLSRRLATPDMPHPEDALKTAIALSRDAAFRKKRSALFDWQELAVGQHWTPEQTVARISEMADAYNTAVKDASGKVRWRLAFTISGIVLGFAFGGPVAAGATAVLSLVQFVKLDRTPAIEAGGAEPAAMFHDVKNRLGLTVQKVQKPRDARS
jgi:hypothetical protein